MSASDETDSKKLKRLQQNRLSALKCRKKKKAQLNTLVSDKDQLESENLSLKQQVSICHKNAFVINSLTNIVQLAEIMKKLDLKSIEAEKLEERLKDLQTQQQMITQNLLEVNKAAQMAAATNRGIFPSVIKEEKPVSGFGGSFEYPQSQLDLNMLLQYASSVAMN